MKLIEHSPDEVLEVLGQFAIESSFPLNKAVVESNKVGHLNATYSITDESSGQGYILQCIDHHIFKDVAGLMRNIQLVVNHLAGNPIPGQVAAELFRTKTGTAFLRHRDGYWRLYRMIPGRVVERCPTPEVAYSVAFAFGAFDAKLSDLPISEFTYTINDFHNVPKRLKALDYIVLQDRLNKNYQVQEELKQINQWRERVNDIEVAIAERRLVKRLYHHDTKINNVLFAHDSDTPIAVVDFDTCMPGVVLSDVGDLARYSVSDSAEDERDLSKIKVRPEYFMAIARGFADSLSGSLKPSEIRLFPIGVILRTLCDGIRFLTDHLMGDQYFSISREDQNLDRARTQLEIVRQLGGMERELSEQMETLIATLR